MKIIAYGVRADERAYFSQWEKETGHVVEQHTELLTPETVKWAEGFDAINVLQLIPYEAAVFEAMRQYGIKFIALRNVGVDNVDLVAAKANGIRLSNTPAYSPEAIAEFSLTLALNLFRRLSSVEKALEADDYLGSQTFIGREIGHSTVGIVGSGRIGRAAGRMFAGFGARVIVYDPRHDDNPDSRIEYVDFETLLAESDIIDLHVPGTAENTHLFDADALAQMKPGAVIINTARGNIIDTKALIANLKSGHLAGAGIDTFENEMKALLSLDREGRFADPLWDELLAMPNVILTPHIAYYTETAVHNMVYYSLENLVKFVTTGEADTEVRF